MNDHEKYMQIQLPPPPPSFAWNCTSSCERRMVSSMALAKENFLRYNIPGYGWQAIPHFGQKYPARCAR